MQIFIIGSIYETAKALDKKRFHRQISEARLIRDGILELNGWTPSILCKMYKNDVEWLNLYIKTFQYIKEGNDKEAKRCDKKASKIKPLFITEEYMMNFKRRLYTKNNEIYERWKDLGESYFNMYYIDNHWKIVEQKK